MIDKELQALTEAYETERWDENSTIGFERLSIIAEDVIDYISKTHEIVSKQKIERIYNLHKHVPSADQSDRIADPRIASVLESLFPQTLKDN